VPDAIAGDKPAKAKKRSLLTDFSDKFNKAKKN
jgi:hypothetical protein